MEPKESAYVINNKTYIQRPLVLGQVLLLAQLIRHVSITPAMNAQALITSLGLKLPEALAIVLIPDGTGVIEKKDEAKRSALAEELSFSIHPETTAQVIEDFFGCNPIASLLEKLSGLTEKVKSQMTEKNPESKPSSSSSAAETSPKETKSSGASPSGSASHT